MEKTLFFVYLETHLNCFEIIEIIRTFFRHQKNVCRHRYDKQSPKSEPKTAELTLHVIIFEHFLIKC